MNILHDLVAFHLITAMGKRPSTLGFKKEFWHGHDCIGEQFNIGSYESRT